MPDDGAAATPKLEKLALLPLRRVLLFGIACGSAFAVIVSITVGLAVLYRSRAKSWDSKAITASFGSLQLWQHLDEQRRQSGFIVEFAYDLQNNTSSDYKPDMSHMLIFAKLPSGALSKGFGDYQVSEPTVDGPALIPSHTRARITATVHYEPPGFADVNWDDTEKLTPIVNRRLRELDGLVLLDQNNHYRIDLPNGWPEAGGKAALETPRTSGANKIEDAPDNKYWESAEVGVTCSKNEQAPSWFSVDGKEKQVTLDCTLKNVTNRAIPLTSPPKMDALFRLANNHVVRGNAYLGSNEHEIPPMGKVSGGLFPGNDDCPAKQPDSDCLQSELMGGNELLLVDGMSGVRFHVRIK